MSEPTMIQGAVVYPKNIWILRLSHRHGDDVLAFVEKKDARNALIDYVVENWELELSEPMPEISDDAAADKVVADYFKRMGERGSSISETYSIEEIALQPPSPTIENVKVTVQSASRPR